MVMFPRYLIYEALKWLKRETTLLWFLLLDPIIPAKEFWVYWGRTAITVLGLMFVEAREKIVHHGDLYWTDKYYHPKATKHFNTLQPLPEDWMVLSTVRLRMGFVGWLGALGKQFTGMTDSLNQIGTNAIWIMSLATKHHCSTLKHRVDSMHTQYSLNKHK